MSFFKEFKEFAIKGNAIDMAVGIIIGAAFGKVISSLVNDVIMPPIGFIVGGVDFSHLSLMIQKATATKPAVLLKWGLFINTIINFLIIAFCIFLVVKGLSLLKREKPKEVTTKLCPECQSEIPKAAKRCAHCTSSLE